MRFGIIGPSEDEIMPFIEEMENKETVSIAMLKFYIGKFNNIDVVALYCGVCKVNAAIATQILIDKFNVTNIIVTVVAGGIDTRLRIGDTVISTEVAYHDVADGILTEYHPWMDSIYFKCDSKILSLSRKVLSENTFPQKIYYGTLINKEEFSLG